MEEVEKFNPYHDERGRFSTAGAGISFTYRTKDPKKQHWADRAIERETERTKDWDKPKKPPNPLGDPDTIGGAKRGMPMNEKQADSGNVNPDFGKVKGCKDNCQSCVVAYEARLRGYDVKAKPKHNNPAADHISHITSDAWIDPATGKPPKMQRNGTKSKWTWKDTQKFLEDNIQEGCRYTFRHMWKGNGHVGHIISATRKNGKLELYDPQTGKKYSDPASIKAYLKETRGQSSVMGFKFGVLGLQRVDNMRINPKYANGIMGAIK